MKKLTALLRAQLTFGLLFLLMLSPLSYAADDSIDCTIQHPYDGEIFKEFYAKTEQTAGIFCQELMKSRINREDLDNTTARSLLEKYADDAKQALDAKDLSKSAVYGDQFNLLKSEFAKFNFKNIKLPDFVVENEFGTNNTQGFFQSVGGKAFTINQSGHCEAIAPGKSCVDIFEDFQAAFSPYRSAYNNAYDKKNAELLGDLSRQWDRFLEASKSQTFFEVMATTYLNRSHFKKNYLVGPPQYQVIALHPELIYSHIKGGPDGASDHMGLAIEWFGVNAWDWKVPFGISCASTYIDSASIKNKGNGIMLHFYNHYSLGWSKHGSENVYFVTLDLFKMYDDKRTRFQGYLDNYYNKGH